MNIKKILEAFEPTAIRMYNGDMYYKRKNIVINERRKTFYSTAAQSDIDDCTKANNKLASGFTKIMVDQKINYSLNKGLNIEADGLDDIIDMKKFKKQLKKVAKAASNKIYGVVQWYIEEVDGVKTLKHKLLPSEQCILICNKDDSEIIDKVIRHYKEDEQEKVEVIDEVVTTYYSNINGEWVEQGIEPHLTQKTTSGNIVINENVTTWGRVPVSVLYNNDEKQTDLEMFKSHVDAYDIAGSDLSNNLEDFQELYWVLKGYNGTNATEFMAEFKKSRILKIDSDGDVGQQAQEVPYAARETTLKILRNDIFDFGMGVDAKMITGDTTNLTIMAMFSNLDLKANAFEEEIEEFIESCIYFVNKFAEFNNKTIVEDVEIRFNRAMILNKAEIITNILSQVGFRAKEKLLAEHPDVTDVEKEIEALNAEREKSMKELGSDLGFEE